MTDTARRMSQQPSRMKSWQFFPPAAWRALSFVVHRSLVFSALVTAAALGQPAAAPPGPSVPSVPSAPGPQLSLDEAIRLALEKNLNLKVSAFSPEIARANVLAEYGRFDPELTFRRDYSQEDNLLSTNPLVTRLTKQDDYSVSIDGSTPWGLSYSLGGRTSRQRGTANSLTDQYVTFGGVTVTQPLLRGFGFGANLAGLRIAKADRNIADWQHRQTVINTVANVIFAYYNLLQARENLRIARFARDLAMNTVRNNEARRRVGAISDADVIQAQSTAASRDDSILLAEQGLRDRQNELRALIGERTFMLTGGDLELAEPPPMVPLTVDAAADLKKAFELRPDYQAHRLGVTRRRFNEALAKNQLLPRVDFVGSYGYSGMDRDFGVARRQVSDQDVRAYSAGVVVSIPFTFAEGRGRLRAARLAVRQFEEDLLRLESDIAVDVTAAAGQIETTRQRVATNRRAVDLARQSLDAEQKKIDAGTGSTFLLLQAQGFLVQVERTYINAVADERRARAAYERELGTILLNRNIQVE
jgi:outer membrane protein